MQETPGAISGSGRFPGEGNGNSLQYSCLENPMNRRAWWATVYGATESNRTKQLTQTMRIMLKQRGNTQETPEVTSSSMYGWALLGPVPFALSSIPQATTFLRLCWPLAFKQFGQWEAVVQAWRTRGGRKLLFFPRTLWVTRYLWHGCVSLSLTPVPAWQPVMIPASSIWPQILGFANLYQVTYMETFSLHS